MLVTAATDLQKDIVEGGRVSRRGTPSGRLVISAQDGAETTAECDMFIRPSCRGQPLLRNFTPNILAGRKGSSPLLKLWAGAPHSCCECKCKRLFIIFSPTGG